MRRERIAVVGSGIAGLTCAHELGPDHDVVLFEAAPRLGGHANTVDVIDPTVGRLPVDTGFIVHNDRNYPNLVRLFDELDVPRIDTEMSFGVTDRDPASPTAGFTYRATSPNTMFADRRNIVRPTTWRMLRDIAAFYRDANNNGIGDAGELLGTDTSASGGTSRKRWPRGRSGVAPRASRSLRWVVTVRRRHSAECPMPEPNLEKRSNSVSKSCILSFQSRYLAL